MFEKLNNLKFKSSVSSFNNGMIYYYDKKNDLHIIGCLDVDMINLTKFKINSKDQIEQIESNQIKIDPIDESTQFCLIEFYYFKYFQFDLFCLISSSGLHVYNDINLRSPIFRYSFKDTIDLLGSINLKDLTFNGLSCLDSRLFLGLSTGTVLVFEMRIIDSSNQQNEDKTISFRFKEYLKQHHYSITYINSATDLVKDVDDKFVKVDRLSVSDALGNISIYHLDGNQLKFIFQFAGYNNYHCVSTKFFEDLLIASYSSGHIRLFSLIDKCLLCEVSAHAKSITCMNICDESGHLITTSEDTFVRIWKLKPEESYIKQEYCYSIKNCLLVSGIFFGEMSKFFCAIAYDENEGFVFRRITKK